MHLIVLLYIQMVILSTYIFVLYYFAKFSTILGHISSNIPAVCDGFVVAIKEREAFQQPQNCGGAKYHKGR
jgi:hypothetical protein